MPLSQQLKSNMTGIPVEAPQKKEAEKPIVEPLNIPNFSSDTPPTPEVGATNQTKAPDVTSGQPDVLKSIENQLIILNQNIIDLGQAVMTPAVVCLLPAAGLPEIGILAPETPIGR